jgi:hypothetical protein
MCHQGEVIGERDRRDQQIALSDRSAAEEIANPRMVLRGATIERDNWERRQHCCPRFTLPLRSALLDAVPRFGNGNAGNGDV